ncbi:hypothetical protein [Marinifilum caeruleilacunae]|uniref:DUF3575 domain-containing protein n=1 Tax=Marinifilum caeruleilacunae TaxID=2499076 RepID=A0ABX1X186_9BACT|nr:hypothetical protein [Marinifilum caeruleilacunae]NOU61853.1 hypothetical protein [Marinifilum caeruleilacunae]
MKKKLLLLLCVITSLYSFAQEKKITASYYHSNEFGLAFFQDKTVYPELRMEARNEQLKDATYSIFLRNDCEMNESLGIDLSCGLGFSYSKSADKYMRLPVYITKKNVFSENLKLMIGLEFKTEFADEFKLLPKIGVGINF